MEDSQFKAEGKKAFAETDPRIVAARIEEIHDKLQQEMVDPNLPKLERKEAKMQMKILSVVAQIYFKTVTGILREIEKEERVTN